MQTLGDTLVKVDAMVLADAPFQTTQETLSQVKSEAQFERLAKRLSKCSIRQHTTRGEDRGTTLQTE